MDETLYDAFCRESASLKQVISRTVVPSAPDAPDLASIIGTYHHVIGISSMITALQDSCTDAQAALLADARDTVAEFDTRYHPGILTFLAESVRLQTDRLADIQSEPDSEQSRLYDLLRQTMSTHEFVGQYDASLGK